MKTRLRLFLPVFIAAVLFTSCSEDDDAVIDTEAPEITINEPHDGDAIAPGSEMHFEATFSDNVELRSYKIEIHSDFDEHTHAMYKSSHDVNPWSYEETFIIPAGRTTYDSDRHIDIPLEFNEAPISEGRYHLGVYVTDVAGNEAQAFLEFEIGDDHDEDHAH